MSRLFSAAAACILLAACSQSNKQATAAAPDANAGLAEANATGSMASAAVTAAVVGSNATPLQKQQALAMVQQRHAGYGQIGKAMRAAKKGLDAKDLPAIRAAAATINTLAPKAAGWFPLGTGNEVVLPGGHKVEAKAEIWKQPQVFAADMKNFRQAAAAFHQAAQGSDLAAIAAAQGRLGGTCKACHERFRAE
jgi:cytochrome c556